MPSNTVSDHWRMLSRVRIPSVQSQELNAFSTANESSPELCAPFFSAGEEAWCCVVSVASTERTPLRHDRAACLSERVRGVGLEEEGGDMLL